MWITNFAAPWDPPPTPIPQALRRQLGSRKARKAPDFQCFCPRTHSFALPCLRKPDPQLIETLSIHPQILVKTLYFLFCGPVRL